MTENPDAKKPKKRNKKQLRQDEFANTANEISSLWMSFRKFVRESFSNKPIDREIEQKFLDLKSRLTRSQRVLAQKVPKGFHYGASKMTDLMGQAVSLATLRDLPVVDKKHIYSKWHEAHISLQHMLGMLDLMGEGRHVVFEEAKVRSGNLKADIEFTGKKKKGKMSAAKIMGILALVAIAAVVVWFMKNS